MKLNILGVEYTLEFRKKEDDHNLMNSDGYADTSVKLLVVEDMQAEQGSKLDLEAYKKQVVRQEVIHAFLFESGLDVNTCCGAWAVNEEIVDWIAIQSPKIIKVFEKAGVL